MEKRDKIYVAGHRGMVGSAIVRKLKTEGYNNLLLRTSSELDLTKQAEVNDFFETEKPDYVFLAAAKVGGILANDTYRAEFLYKNLLIEANIIEASHIIGAKKLLFLGSSCIYPKFCPQPIKEEYLLTGTLENTNEPYAIAKIAGIKLCETYNQQYGSNFISVLPTNLYGPNDNYHPENSHVVPALLRKFHLAVKNNEKQVIVWGTGTPLREFLHVDDLANACYFLMHNYDKNEPLNIGTGEDISIKDLAETISDIIGFKGDIIFDQEKPDGTPKKLLDVSKIRSLGWKHEINLREGLEIVYSQVKDELN